MKAARNIFEKGREKDFSAMLGIMFLGEHSIDMYDLYGRKPQTCMKFRQKRQHIARKGVLKGVRFDKHETLIGRTVLHCNNPLL
jgi:hypothetical protein